MLSGFGVVPMAAACEPDRGEAAGAEFSGARGTAG